MKRFLSIVSLAITSLCYGQYTQSGYATGLIAGEVSGGTLTSSVFAGGVLGSETLTGGSYTLLNGLIFTSNTTANRPPTVPNYTFDVEENSPEITLVGVIEASDPDNDPLTYSIVSGNDQMAFAVTNNARIIVAEPAALDFETTPTFILEIEVSDGIESVISVVTINLIDIDESGNSAPEIADQTFSIDENSANGTLVGTVQASDEDDDDLLFSIASQTDDAFAINETSGELSVANSQLLDFETTPALELNVQISDGTDSASAIMLVELNDVDEEENTAPNVEDQVFTLDENAVNESLVGQIEATDAQNDELTFTILEGNTEGVLQLVETTGEIVVLDASQIDANQTSEYNMLVSVSDGQLSTEAIILIEVLSESDNTVPTIEDQSFTVDVNVANNEVIGTLNASDPENDPLSFFIDSGNESGVFALHENSGQLSVIDASQIDINTIPNYELTVIVFDGELTDAALVTITVIDESENTPPGFEAQTFSVLENSSVGTNIGILEATDSDGDVLTFTLLSGNESGAFALNAATGEINVANSTPLDFETTESFTLQVEVGDGITTTSASVTISILDQDEGNNSAPTVASAIGNQSFLENTGSLRVDVTGTFTDPDGDELRLVAASADTSLIYATISGEELVLLGKNIGTTTIEVTAYDDRGGITSTSFSATLEENNNSEPTVSNPIDDVVLTEGFESYRVDLTNVFEDQDGGTLTYDVKSGSDVELIADFVILPECCGNTTGTGRYLDGVYIEFENRSSDNAVRYDWSFGSTKENPSGYFTLNNLFAVNAKTFKLTVTDADGNQASVEKSYEFPMLLASGYIEVDGQTFDLNQYDQQVDFRIDYHQYTDGNVGQGFLGYTFSELPINMVLRIGGYPPGSVNTGMRQVEAFSPTASNNFFFSYGNYSTIGDDGGTLSGGSVTLNNETKLDNVIDEISLEGVIAFQTDETDQKPFKIVLKHVPVTCYYDGVFCIEGTDSKANSFLPMTRHTASTSLKQAKQTQFTSNDGVITTIIDGNEIVITEVGIGETNVLVSATDNAGAVVTDQFSFEIEEQENRFPEIDDQIFKLNKTAATQGQLVGTVVATDEDEDPLTFGIDMGNEDGIFTLDSQTGELTIADLSALQSSSEETFYLDVFASDGQFSSGALVTIETSSAPIINDQTFSIDENSEAGTVVGSVIATDADGDALTYSIIDGNTSNTFSLNANTGILTVASSAGLDFENTPTFDLTIDVSDGNLSAVGTITINLIDIDEIVLGVHDKAGNKIIIYPNPAQNFVKVEWSEFDQATISELSGKNLFESKNRMIDLRELNIGIYLVTLKSTTGENIVFRLIKE